MDRVRLKKMINQIKDSVEGKNLPNIYLLHSDLTDWEMNPLYNHPKVKLTFHLREVRDSVDLYWKQLLVVNQW